VALDSEDITQQKQHGNFTFREFSQVWLATYVENNNKYTEQRAKHLTFRNHLLPWFGHLPLQDITSKSIEGYKKDKIDRPRFDSAYAHGSEKPR